MAANVLSLVRCTAGGPSCPPPARYFCLEGRASGVATRWYGCQRHATILRELIYAIWRNQDPEGLLTFTEGDVNA